MTIIFACEQRNYFSSNRMLGRSVDEELLDGEEDLSFSPLTKAGEGVNLKQ